MKFLGVVATIAVFVGLVAACSHGEQQPDSTNDVASTVVAQSTVTPATNASGATLTVQPVNVDGCKPDQPMVARLNWRSNIAKVRVLVTNPGQPTRLFSESGFAGSAKTGNWVVAGTKFELVDPVTEHVLATRIMSAGPCASPASPR